MSDFDATREALAAARAGQAAARQTAWQAGETARALQARVAATPDSNPDRPALAEQARAAADDAAQAGAGADAARAHVVSELGAFTQFTDPRAQLGRLPDRSPIALLPLRIETRFQRAGETEQLWVRIFPDDCSIDTFEPTLSSTEVASAKRYWAAMWAAGGAEAGQRAAWAALVAAHGSGRAGFVADGCAPLNPAGAPVRAHPSDELLIIPTQTAPAAADATALAAYWTAVWRAGDDTTALTAARTALHAAVGAAHGGDLLAAYVPANLADAPVAPGTRGGVAVSVSILIFGADPPVKTSSWSQAPHVTQLPERFVVLGFDADGVQTLEAIGSPVNTPLYVGPDPAVDPGAGIHPDGADLFVPEELAWLVDFSAAVTAGVGLRIDLSAQQAAEGFARLLVLGVQMATSDDAGATALAELLTHHHVGAKGLSLVPQGTPAHNTTASGTGWQRLDDADQSFEDRRAAPLFTVTADPTLKRDGQWLAEALGIDPATLTGVHAAGGRDGVQGRAMARALWPATLGYWMDKMLTPVFGDETVAQTRAFFTGHVCGEGIAPVIAVGEQPYGILPTTAFSRIAWPNPKPEGQMPAQTRFLAELLRLLRTVDADWAAMSQAVASVGDGGDPHATLLEVIGLHADSAEYAWRYSESLSELYNVVALWGLGPQFWDAITALDLQAEGEALLQRLGYAGAAPDLLAHVFMSDAGEVSTIIDTIASSETRPLSTTTTDGRNYLRWLADAATAGLPAVAAEQGFTDDASPRALLYLLARHALQFGYHDTSYALHRSAAFLTPAELEAFKPEHAFVHVDPSTAVSESRYAPLFKAESRITSSTTQLVHEYISANLATLAEAEGLREQIAALELLQDATTAQLERAFAMHVDTCSHRLDAWMLGLVGVQLEQMRAVHPTGVYLGAYGWLEHLRPSVSRLTPARVTGAIEERFGTATPLLHDPQNEGYIHAPSLPHARTAAVLRSGYKANATPANPDTLAVNLSSDRVRTALSILEGIRGGQSIGALLGYRLERGLHDDHAIAEVDQYVYSLRKAFPLVADQLGSTQTPPGVPIQAIEARNVVDGRKLVAQMRDSGQPGYPFGVGTLPTGLPPAAVDAINAEAGKLLDAYDAIADLALAEGVHQAVQGNFDRVSATLEAYSSGAFPPDPQVVQTPATGIGLTHRVALHLDAAATAPAGATPRAVAEPALDAWLAAMLGNLAGVGCTVVWTDPVGGAARSAAVTLADLGLRPLDLIVLIKPDDVQAMAELDDRVLRHVHATAAPRPDAALVIRYATAPAGLRSAFEVAALARSLRAVVERARPLRATDAVLANQARPADDAAVAADRARVAGPLADLGTLAADLGAALTPLQALLRDPVANRAALIAQTDTAVDAAVGLLERAARFGVPQSGWGFAYEWRRGALADLLAAVAARVLVWQGRLADYDARIAAYDALPAATADADRFVALQAAEALVTGVLDPLPATPAMLRSGLDAKRAAFAAFIDGFVALAPAPYATFTAAYDAVAALLPVAAYDGTSLDLTPFGDRAVAICSQLSSTLAGHATSIAGRQSATQAQLAVHDAAATATAQIDALQAAAKALLGSAFVLIPSFTVSAAQAAELKAAVDAGAPTGPLLSYLRTTAGLNEPVDTWLYGAARVRPMLAAWERTMVLAGALGHPVPALVPAQLPYRAAASWLALEAPDLHTLDSDRLLYTAHYATPFDPTTPQCGLLLDDWTEVIPGTTKDTGLTFNYDRPDSEPPQAILLVTPASATGSWEWDDLVGALNETLDLAKKRAVEPAAVDATPYARFLPATIMAATLHGITIATSLAASSGVMAAEEIARRA